MKVPTEICETISGNAQIGRWEPCFAFMTVDNNGFPHPCLVSRTELEVHDGHLLIVLRRSTSTDNLMRTRAATLLVAVEKDVHCCKLRLENLRRYRDLVGARLSVHCDVTSTVGVFVHNLRFMPTQDLEKQEH